MLPVWHLWLGLFLENAHECRQTVEARQHALPNQFLCFSNWPFLVVHLRLHLSHGGHWRTWLAIVHSSETLSTCTGFEAPWECLLHTDPTFIKGREPKHDEAGHRTSSGQCTDCAYSTLSRDGLLPTVRSVLNRNKSLLAHCLVHKLHLLEKLGR